MTPVQIIIQRSKAVLVLIVFGLSLVPRQVIHNFVTSHKHIKYSEHSGKAQVATETFSCKADTVFLQQGFDKVDLTINFTCSSPAATPGALILPGIVSASVPQHNLRGPPSIS